VLGETAEDPAVHGSGDAVQADRDASHQAFLRAVRAVGLSVPCPGRSRLQRCIVSDKTALLYDVILLPLGNAVVSGVERGG
jgi:hypothetical protein